MNSLDDAEFETMLQEDAARFEMSLRESREAELEDAKERAHARMQFYMKQSELRTQRARLRGSATDMKDASATAKKRVARNRRFSAYCGERYHGPLIPDENGEIEKQITQLHEKVLHRETASQTSNTVKNTKVVWPPVKPQPQPPPPRIVKPKLRGSDYPVFLGEDGTIYDLHFLPIAHVDELKKTRKRGRFHSISSQSEEERNPTSPWDKYEFISDPVLYSTIPDPQHFESFDDFEQALLSWRNEVDRSLGYLQLPRVMGRHYFRPYFHAANKMELSEDQGQDLDEFGFFNKPVEKDATWEANLAPLEPKPEFYDTYEEYESAFLRWHIVCSGLPFLAPHASQFENLLGIKKARPSLYPEQEDSSIHNQKSSAIDVAKGRRLVPTQQKGQKQQSKPQNDISRSIDSSGLTELWDTLSETSRAMFRDSVETVLKRKMERKIKYGTFHVNQLPKLHGRCTAVDRKILRRFSLSKIQLKVGCELEDPRTVKEWISLQRQERSISNVFTSNAMPFYQAIAEDLKHQTPLRRLDLDAAELNACKDCRDFEQEVAVEFKIPDFDIGQIDLSITQDEAYVRFLQVLLLRMDHATRFDNLNSWYFPQFPKKAITEHQSQMGRILASANVQTASNIDPVVFTSIFCTPAHLDTFCAWLDVSVSFTIQDENSSPLRTHREVMYAACMSDPFDQLLVLFGQSNSLLVHAKIARFILDLLQTQKAHVLLSAIIDNQDIEQLFLLTKAVTLFDEVPVPLFQYDSLSSRPLIKQLYGDETDNLIKQFVSIYYLNLIAVSLLEEEAGFPDVYPLIIRKIDAMLDTTLRLLKQHTGTKFLSQHLWSMLGNRSCKLCELGFFVVRQLFNLAFKDELFDIVSSPECGLVSNLRRLAQSRFSHVQTAIARIFPHLRDKAWRQLLHETYANANEVVKDIKITLPPSTMTPSASFVSPLDAPPPILSSLVLSFFTKTFREANSDSKTMISQLLCMHLFHSILSEVLETAHQLRITRGTIVGTEFLEEFAKCAMRMKLLDASKTDRFKAVGSMFSKLRKGLGRTDSAMSPGSAQLQIGFGDIQGMVDFSHSTKRLRREYRPCIYMLNALRPLIKCPAIFELVRKDNDFFAKVVNMCRDGMDMEFNRSAWRLVYHMIKYNTGVVDLLISGKFMLPLFEAVSGANNNDTTGGAITSAYADVVITNSACYLHKVLQLPKKSEDFSREWSPSEEVKRGYEKSVDSLVRFFAVKQRLDSVQSKYRQLSSNHAGWPFQNLAKLYKTLSNDIRLSKLMQ